METQTEKQKRILLVEDDETLRLVYIRLLHQEGYFVDSAITGNEGYEKMAVGGYDLVLLDVLLPGMGGMEILEKLQIQHLPSTPNKTIVFLTNLEKEEHVAQALKYNIAGYMIKSDFTATDFICRVKKYLDKK